MLEMRTGKTVKNSAASRQGSICSWGSHHPVLFGTGMTSSVLDPAEFWRFHFGPDSLPLAQGARLI